MIPMGQRRRAALQRLGRDSVGLLLAECNATKVDERSRSRSPHRQTTTLEIARLVILREQVRVM